MKFLLIYAAIGLTCFLALLWLMYVGFTFKKHWSFNNLFRDFNRKIWMTICLGTFFLITYILFVALGIQIVRYWGNELFFLIYHNPILFIYAGLFFFASFSLSIYFARMIIKYFYLTRGKDG